MGDSIEKNIFDQVGKSNQIVVVNMSHNLSYRYYSNHIIIKYIGFKLIHYAILSSRRFLVCL